jgi:hypothetical protein
VGDHGVIVHWDGSRWTVQQSGVCESLHDVWGSGDLVYAVGDRGVILRWDGTSWEQQESHTSASLRGLWGSGPADIHAVGARGTILRFDGASWNRQQSRTAVGLYSVWGSGPEDVYAAGQRTTILHFDGSTWSRQHRGEAEEGEDEDLAPPTILSLWGSGPDDVYAAATGGLSEALVLRRQGGEWQPVEVEAPEGVGWVAVWGSSAEEVLLLGENGTGLRFDGRRWNPLPQGPCQQVTDVGGPSVGRAFVVGLDGCVMSRRGRSWTLLQQGTLQDLNSVWGVGPGVVYAKGPEISLRRHGQSWKRIDEVPARALKALQARERGVALPPSKVDPRVEDVLLGPSVLMDLPTKTWAAGPGAIFGVTYGHVFRLVDRLWLRQHDGGGWAIHGNGPESLYVVHGGREILHYDGSSWREHRIGSSARLRDVWVSAQGEAVVVGEHGVVLRKAP